MSASARGGFGGGGFHGGGFHGGFAGGWHGVGWRGAGWRGGFGPALAGGLIAGAVIGGVTSSAYAWGPGYGYYDEYAPVYAPGPGYGYHGYPGCPESGYGEYYNCGAYAVPGYGGYAPAYYGW
jgi:hypothetical protein